MTEETTVEKTTTEPAGETPAGGEPKAPKLDSVMAELADVREALKRANAEAAERRIKLREFEEAEEKRRKAEMTDLEKLQSSNTELQANYDRLVAAHDGLLLRQAFYDAVAGAELQFASDQARRDAYELVDLAAAIDGGEISTKAVKDALSELQKSRPYLFGKPTLPDDDASKKSAKAQAATEDEVKEFAARMGLDWRVVDPVLLGAALGKRQ